MADRSIQGECEPRSRHADSAPGEKAAIPRRPIGGDPVLPETGVEGAQTDPKLVRGFPAIALVRGKRRQDRFPLEFPKGLFGAPEDNAGGDTGEMQEGGGNALVMAEDHRALDDVMKLPDVAGPGVVLQDRRHPSAKPAIRLPNRLFA